MDNFHAYTQRQLALYQQKKKHHFDLVTDFVHFSGKNDRFQHTLYTEYEKKVDVLQDLLKDYNPAYLTPAPLPEALPEKKSLLSLLSWMTMIGLLVSLASCGASKASQQHWITGYTLESNPSDSLHPYRIKFFQIPFSREQYPHHPKQPLFK